MLYPLSYEGGGCAIRCANCADRSRFWCLEVSRALLGGFRSQIRVDRARRLRVTGGGPRSSLVCECLSRLGG